MYKKTQHCSFYLWPWMVHSICKLSGGWIMALSAGWLPRRTTYSCLQAQFTTETRTVYWKAGRNISSLLTGAGLNVLRVLLTPAPLNWPYYATRNVTSASYCYTEQNTYSAQTMQGWDLEQAYAYGTLLVARQCLLLHITRIERNTWRLDAKQY